MKADPRFKDCKLVWVIAHDGLFAYGTAFASRLVNFCRLFTLAGYTVHVIAAYTKDPSVKSVCIYRFEEVTYQITDIDSRNSIDTFIGDTFIGPKYFYRNIVDYVKTQEIDCVSTSRGITHFGRLQRLCSNKNTNYLGR